MTRTVFCGLLSGVISLTAGCANKTYHETRCFISYDIKTFPSEGHYRLHVDAVKYDRFGRMSVRVAPGQSVRFLNPWLSEGFISEDCR